MKHVILIACLLVINPYNASAFIRCKLSGEVKGIHTKAIWLKKVSEDMRRVIDKKERRIPVKHGAFEYEFTAEEIDAYEFVFDEDLGSTWGLIFFPDDGLIRMVIQRSGIGKELICEGGDYNAEYAAFKTARALPFAERETVLMALRDALLANGDYYSDAYEVTREELKQAGENEERKAAVFRKRDEMKKTGAQFSNKGAQFNSSYDSLMQAQAQWTFEYILKNKTPISYFLLYNMTRFAKPGSVELALASQAFPLFEKEFPQHPYTRILRDQLAGVHFIMPGYRYIDVEAKTLEGKTVALSSVLKGKVNLINLWGSWCGPCITKGRQIVPLYNQYKDKGFEVVGIAREFKDLNALKSRLSKEQFNWMNLVELDDENGIWSKYVIADGAGLLVLTDQAGVILAVNPSPEELEKIIKGKLQNDTKN